MQECTKMINRNVQKILHKSVQVCFGSYRRNMKLVTKARQEEKMNISINRDIEKYQETVVMGLTARQLIFSIASIACGGAIVLLTYRHVGLTGSAYIAIPVVAPLALNGFYSYQGMSFTQMFKRKLWFAFKNRPLTYISEESEKTIKRMRMEEERQRKKEDKRKKRKIKRKTKEVTKAENEKHKGKFNTGKQTEEQE